MNEEDKEEITEVDQEVENASVRQGRSNRKPLIITLALIGIVVLAMSVFWIFRNRSGGQPVPHLVQSTLNRQPIRQTK